MAFDYEVHDSTLAQIADLEAALAVFVKDREEAGCCECFFTTMTHREDSWHCTIPDDDQRPCRMGWREWAIREGRERRNV